MLLILVLVLARPKKLVTWTFTTYLFIMLAYGLCIFFMRSSPDLSQAHNWEHVLVGLGTWLAVILFDFCLQISGIPFKRWKMLLFYIPAVILSIPAVASLAVTAMSNKPYGYAPVFGPVAFFWIPFVFLLPLASVSVMAVARRRTSTPAERNRFTYIIIGLGASIIGGMFDILPTFGLPSYPGTVIGLIILCIMTAVAILRENLLDIRVVARRGLGYLLTSAIAAIPYVTILILVNRYIDDLVQSAAAYFALLFAAALVLQPLWRFTQGWIDRLFLRGRFEALRTLDEITYRSYSIERFGEFATSVNRLMTQALNIETCRLFILEEDSYNEIGALGNPLKVQVESPLVQLLRKSNDLIRASACTVPELMPVASALGVLGCEATAPIKANDGRLLGFICPGRKRDGYYNVEDEQLIMKTASRLAVTVENAYLFRSEQALRREIEREVKDRTEFLVAAAHEMRTPLTSIMAAGEMLAGEVPTDPNNPIFQLVDNIRAAADALHHRTSELLEFARMRSGALDLKLDAVDVNQLVAGLPRQFAPILKQREQELAIEPHPSALIINADYNRLQQVITNLLSNAAKFSPLKARLLMRVESNGDEAVVRVIDRAAPLSDVERGKIFQPFYRGEDLRKPGTGLGLGLAISRQIIAAHQGRIWVDVTRDGNIFSFSVPLLPTDNPPT